MKRKYRWGIVSDIIRELANPSNHNIGLNQTENENALNDMADIMAVSYTHLDVYKRQTI